MYHFSHGPTAKRPGWYPGVLSNAAVGRSHRSKPAKSKIISIMEMTQDILGLPKNYLIGLVPGSDTGAVEIALWSMLGNRGVEMLIWEAFGKEWANDIIEQLQIDDVIMHSAPWSITRFDQNKFPDKDVVFTWNGTTSGVKIPNGDWIADDRNGLVIVDATSACFAMEIPWQKLDVITFSFQKALGGEGAHGVMILSPKGG